jgi:putative membrane protein
MKARTLIFSLSLAAASTMFGQRLTDREFVDKAAQDDMTEAHIGQMAQDKGDSQAAKDLGKTLERDHKEHYGKLSAAAGGLTVPKGIDARHQAVINKLDRLSGSGFDRQFARMMVDDHQKAITMNEKASTELNSAELRNLASETVPTLKNHLQMARDLAGEMTSKASPLGSPAAGTAERRRPVRK